MAVVAVLESGSLATEQAWAQGIQAAGHVVADYTAGVPAGAQFDVAAYLGAGNNALALDWWNQGKSVISAFQPQQGLPFVGSWTAGEPVSLVVSYIQPSGTSPLGIGWATFGPVEQVGQPAPATLAAGTQVYGTYLAPNPYGVAQGWPMYLLYQQGGRQFWLALFTAIAPPQELVSEVGTYITSRYGTTVPCGGGLPCPQGQVCLSSGVCGPCSATAPCPTGQVCDNGTCVTSTGGGGATSCPGGDLAILGQCIPWWLLALLGVGAAVALSGGGGGDGAEKKTAAPRRRRPAHRARPRVVTRTVVRHVRQRVTPHEASLVLRRRAEQLERGR
jgi:hypothetical protein